MVGEVALGPDQGPAAVACSQGRVAAQQSGSRSAVVGRRRAHREGRVESELQATRPDQQVTSSAAPETR